MKPLIPILFALTLSGCFQTRTGVTQTIKEDKDGQRVIQTEIVLPRLSHEGSSVFLTPDGGIESYISGAQDEAKIQRAGGAAKGLRMVYIIGALGIIIGGVLIALKKTSTMGGLAICASGAACIAVGAFVPAIEAMAIPIIGTVVVVGIAYLAWAVLWRKKIDSPKNLLDMVG